MDKLNRYRQIVAEYLEDFCNYDTQAQFIFDIPRDRYMVIHNEWRDQSRIYGCAMHLDIIENQIWIQHNSTEFYIERDLLRRGVEPEDIVFGFRAPSIRKLLVEDAVKKAQNLI
ncbi:element excision factor XisI family protein [Roseofilum capinflatum]|uniref:Element excision factor XisI family protein n=1 Tax=Roseofilum capinflatum BLCC-M114 TaxID=3022440 RepID=A0ABT7B701_9CYAN|nr:element excision factor XisI family protein [Roseofilum capinflatum]MDJ1174409.1 element excision factor XisI family protein [Roseofilum capinflatum BLCC-M114]